MNYYQKIYDLLIEGASTGGSPLLTGIKTGKALKKRKGANIGRGIKQADKITDKIYNREKKKNGHASAMGKQGVYLGAHNATSLDI